MGARGGARGGAGPAPANPVGSAPPLRAVAPGPASQAPTHPAPDRRPREPGARPQPADRGGARDSGPSRDVGGSGSCSEPGPPSPPPAAPPHASASGSLCPAWSRAPGRGRGGRQERPGSSSLGSSPLHARPQGPGRGLWREAPGRSGRRGGSEGAAAAQRSRGREVPDLGRGSAGPSQTVPRGSDKPRAKCRETGCDLFSRRACSSGERGAVPERRAKRPLNSAAGTRGPRGAGRGAGRLRQLLGASDTEKGTLRCRRVPGSSQAGPFALRLGRGVTPSAVRPAGPRPLLAGLGARTLGI